VIKSVRPTCAVVIPTYNGVTLTCSCVEALLGSPPTDAKWQIIVVDDASTDSTLTALDRYAAAIHVIARKENGGFAQACNRGASAAGDCDYLVFLNNDTIPVTGWLDALVREASVHARAAAVGAKLLFPDGTVQHAGIAISQDRWPRHLYAGFPGEHPAVNRAKEVVAATAACLLIRREDFDAMNGFDSAFHNGYEDVDLCLRLREAGREIRYCPSSVVYHLESVTRWPSGAESTEPNDQLYDRRWRRNVTPNDIQTFIDDGLLTLDYGLYHPLTMTVSPFLAAIRRDGDETSRLERLLTVRSRQVMDLLAAQTRSELAQRAANGLATRLAPRTNGSHSRVVSAGRTQLIGNGSARHLVSLLLPVKNEADSLRALLPLVLDQDTAALLEIVAVDSGSGDDTIDVLREFDATVLAIPAADFDHGLTRNIAAENAKGDMLVFLNGRSRPVGRDWLGPLLAAVDGDPLVAGACSRIVAHPDADLITMRDTELELSGATHRQRKQITDWAAYEQLPAEERRAFLNFHTVSAALRADTFAQIKFQSVRTIGEDLLWARDVIESGWALVHEPASVAYHSHSYSLVDVFARNVDDGVANRDINGRVLDESDVRPLIDSLVGRDWRYLREHGSLDERGLERWQREAVLRRVAQVVGQWVGVNYRDLPDGVTAAFSRIARTRGEAPRSLGPVRR
jgi:GT2 family glycosyltransferase